MLNYSGIKKALTLLLRLNAEKEGFEPPVPLGTMVFKTIAIDHSATSLGLITKPVFERVCKAILIMKKLKFQHEKF